MTLRCHSDEATFAEEESPPLFEGVKIPPRCSPSNMRSFARVYTEANVLLRMTRKK